MKKRRKERSRRTLRAARAKPWGSNTDKPRAQPNPSENKKQKASTTNQPFRTAPMPLERISGKIKEKEGRPNDEAISNHTVEQSQASSETAL